MTYVDGFVLAVPKAKMSEYKQMAELGRTVWMEAGAIGYFECEADDVAYGDLTSFPRAVMATDDEVVIFSWIAFRDRASRDEINAKVMKDPRMKMDQSSTPFDGKRMIYGGFKAFVQA